MEKKEYEKPEIRAIELDTEVFCQFVVGSDPDDEWDEDDGDAL